MKYSLFFFLTLAFGATINAQDITNTLGTNGTYIIEDVNNNSLIRTSRSTTPKIIIGDYSSSFNLPPGDIDFVHNNGSDQINLVVGRGSAFSAFPKLQFYYTPGDLSSPTAVTDNNLLGAINFFGSNGSSWISQASASLTAQVDGTLGTSIPGRLELTTQNSSGDVNTLKFNSSGNLLLNPHGADNNISILGTDGSITFDNLKGSGNSNLEVDANGKIVRSSGALTTAWKTILSGNYTVLATDHTVIVSSLSTITLPDPTSSGNSGKTYIIKRGGASSTVTIVSSGTNIKIDGSSSITLNSDWSYIKVQAVGLTSGSATTWIIIGGEGFTRN